MNYLFAFRSIVVFKTYLLVSKIIFFIYVYFFDDWEIKKFCEESGENFDEPDVNTPVFSCSFRSTTEQRALYWFSADQF